MPHHPGLSRGCGCPGFTLWGINRTSLAGSQVSKSRPGEPVRFPSNFHADSEGFRQSLGCPEAFVYFAGLVFEEWPGDDNRFLSAGENFAAGAGVGGGFVWGAGV